MLHVVSGLGVKTGGPGETIPRLCLELKKLGHEIEIATRNSSISQAVQECEEAGVAIRRCGHHTTRYNTGLEKAIPRLVISSDIIHSHGLWLPSNWVTGLVARLANKPLIISPRGTLQPNALNISKTKKEIAAFLFEKKNLHGAACLHATSTGEAQSFRRYGLKNPVCIIPNGVDISQFLGRAEALQIFGETFPEVKNKRILLFLSRLHPIKGIETLIKVWSKMSQFFPEWCLVIAGSDECGYSKTLMDLASHLAAHKSILFTGFLQGDLKVSAFKSASLFVLPSKTENFGLAIAEALASGCPVITTKGTPWAELEDYKCGWWIDICSEALEKAMCSAMQLPTDKLVQMGKNGKRLVENRYTWERVAANMSEVYKWLAGIRTIPKSVSSISYSSS